MYTPCVLDNWLAQHCGCTTDSLPHALRAKQAARMRTLLQYARQHSPFYAQHFAAIPQQSLTLDNLTTLPLTTAHDLLNWGQFVCVSMSEVARMVTLYTSGTTGLSKRLAFSQADLHATRDFFQVGMSQLVQPGERVLALWPGAERPNGVGALLRDALSTQNIQVITGNPTPNAFSLRHELSVYNPHVIVAAPQQLAVLIYALKSKPRPATMALRGILSSAESLSPEMANTLRTTYGLEVLDHYGMTEMGYGGGVECPAHHGYHLRELDILFEIVDIYTGAPVADGIEGEIVITTLNHTAMPLIRYATGDVASILPGPCNCGSPLRRLSHIRGRLVREKDAVHIEHIAKGHFYERTAHTSL